MTTYTITFTEDFDFRVDFASGAPSIYRRSYPAAEEAALEQVARERKIAENLAAREQAPAKVVENPGLHLQMYTLRGEPTNLCPACAAKTAGLTKWSGEVINGYCDGCGAGPSVSHYRLVEAPTCELCGEPAELVGEQWTCPGCSPSCDPTTTPTDSDPNDLIREAVAAAANRYEPTAEELAEFYAWVAELEAEREAEEAAVAYTLPAAGQVRAALDELLTTALNAGDALNARALDRAIAMLDAGLYAQVEALADGALMVPSQRAGEQPYRASDAGCTCPAGKWGKPCAHSALVEGVVVARDAVAAQLDDEAEYWRMTRTAGRMAA